MTVNVNPPPRLRTPDAFSKDREVRAYVEQLQTIVFQLYNRTGGDGDEITDLIEGNTSSLDSNLQQVIKRLNGLPQFTIDTTGFTVDTTLITVDKATT